MRKKRVLILLIVTIVLIIGIITISLFIYKKYKEDLYLKSIDRMISQIISSKLTDETYIKIKKNNKYGFIGEDGKVKVDFVYDEATDFSMAVEKEGKKYYFAIAKRNNEEVLITKDGKEIKDEIKYPKNSTTWIGSYVDFNHALEQTGNKIHYDTIENHGYPELICENTELSDMYNSITCKNNNYKIDLKVLLQYLYQGLRVFWLKRGQNILVLRHPRNCSRLLKLSRIGRIERVYFLQCRALVEQVM